MLEPYLISRCLLSADVILHWVNGLWAVFLLEELFAESLQLQNPTSRGCAVRSAMTPSIPPFKGFLVRCRSQTN